MNFSDKRRYPRVVLLQTKPVKVEIIGAGLVQLANAQDISVGGLSLLVGHSFEGYDLEQEFSLVVKLPQSKAFMAKGKLRHRSFREGKGAFGVEFTTLGKAERALVEGYVDSMLSLGRRTA